ncbi:MAG TPA: CoA ester lyase [Hyphomicrobiaceae bacterium]|nr:CoA ester lyase [Hyphomicrobiaceae bacterium]
MQFRPRRSALYMPASNARALEKAKTLPADMVIFDLEDAVAPEAKPTAREQAAAAARSGGYGGREVVIRINALDTPWGENDVAAAVSAAPDGILVPKIATPDDARRIAPLLAGASQRTRLWLMIETPLAILRIADIAALASEPAIRLAGFVMGTNDLAKETRADLGADRVAGLYWFSAAITAARAFGLDVLDGVYNNFRDLEGFRRECELGRRLGMDGKTLIHPDQIAVANEVFAPSADEIAWSRKVIAAFERAENKGKGVITVEGRMVEIMHADIARRTVAIADAIAGRGP